MPMKLLARHVSAYAYDFTYQSAPFFLPKLPGFRPLAAHTIDIQFLFTGYHGGALGVNVDQTTGMPRDLNADESHLSDQMIGFWTNFAATGNPNKPGSDLWPAFTTDAPVILREDVPLAVESEVEPEPSTRAISGSRSPGSDGRRLLEKGGCISRTCSRIHRY
jgi:para-nitrobenzyl esterase